MFENMRNRLEQNLYYCMEFNLNIIDLPDVLFETKRVLNGEVLSTCLPLCVEISLRTAEGDQMVLETWSFGILPERCDWSPRIVNTVYNRMTIMLKSLASVTRVLPAYKLSRKQGEDTFVICYRIYMDEPQIHCLGEGYKCVRVAQLYTPVGLLMLSVAYRTKMTISPTHTDRDSIMLKSDHFNTNLSPKNGRYDDTRGPDNTVPSTLSVAKEGQLACRNVTKLGPDNPVPSTPSLAKEGHLPCRYDTNEDKITSLSDTMKKIGAFADCKKKDFESELIIPNAPFSRLFTVSKASPKSVEENDLMENAINDCRTTVDSVEETKESERLTEEPEIEPKTVSNGNSKQERGSKLEALTMVSTNDDFIMVDLRTPFGSVTENSELGRFYREWQAAPPLQAFIDLPPLEEVDVSKQLENFETEANEYNTVLQSLCQSPNNN
ncbi:unnamed protein product [Acanthoscelides obtectus]|uniref:Autophagy-related protein 13 n=1 Tax=Acanthoscelides obtectus TaxID=200917 RepID=A0A9P0PIU6_ACAOB|nr:unnamed protein product [Acanthoscelides obtectus]CAK1673145.1 Autophagy-related protein 13 homolog [Acanthoscelides obtectus]